jgi:hypothetical protein
LKRAGKRQDLQSITSSRVYDAAGDIIEMHEHSGDFEKSGEAIFTVMRWFIKREINVSTFFSDGN